MERHKCKLCFRNFGNGRALGGHMRSHMMNLFASNQEKENTHFQSSSSSSSSSEENAIYFRKSKKARKSSVFHSGTNYNKEYFGKYNDEQSPLSSISDTTTPEENVAYCLMMLSRDKWEKEEEEEKKFEDCICDFSEESIIIKVKKSKKLVRGKYRCETCGKKFRSYQALGGHRASHKKIKVAPTAAVVAAETAAVEERIYECPFCHRVFSSGQALGGHKRSHFVGASAISENAGAISAIKRFSGNSEIWDIDLNLPAPTDDE